MAGLPSERPSECIRFGLKTKVGNKSKSEDRLPGPQSSAEKFRGRIELRMDARGFGIPVLAELHLVGIAARGLRHVRDMTNANTCSSCRDISADLSETNLVPLRACLRHAVMHFRHAVWRQPTFLRYLPAAISNSRCFPLSRRRSIFNRVYFLILWFVSITAAFAFRARTACGC